MTTYIPVIVGAIGFVGLMAAAAYNARSTRLRQEAQFAEDRRIAEEKRVAELEAARAKHADEMRQVWAHMQPNIQVTTNSPYMPVNYDTSSHHNASASGQSGASTGSYSPVSVGGRNGERGAGFKYLVIFLAFMLVVGLVWSVYAFNSADREGSTTPPGVSTQPTDSPATNTPKPTSSSSDGPNAQRSNEDDVNKFESDLHKMLREHRKDRDLAALNEYYDFPVSFFGDALSPRGFAGVAWPSKRANIYQADEYVKTCRESDGEYLVVETSVDYDIVSGPRAGQSDTAHNIIKLMRWSSGQPFRVKSVDAGTC